MATIQGRFGKLIADFYYLGIRCREKTSLEDNPANRKKLAAVLKKIDAEITLNIFDYTAYFPKSARLKEMVALANRAEACISRNLTFKQFSVIFYEEKKIEWRPSYRQKIQIILDKYLLPEFGGKAVHAIKKTRLTDLP